MITQEQELKHFVHNWQQKPAEAKPQIVEEIASDIQESNRLPDYYFYDFDQDGNLCSPTSGEKISNLTKRRTYVERAEGQVVDGFNKAIKNGHRLLAWVSPPYPGVYTDLKIVVSEVVQHQGRERFLNRSFLFDFDFNRSWIFAQEIAQISPNKPQLNCLEDIRSLALILDSNQDWLDHLARITDKPALVQYIKNGDDYISKQQALIHADEFYEKIIKQPSTEVRINVKEYGFGDYTSSCPPSEGSSESWWDYNLVTHEYKCKLCLKRFSKEGIKKHRCVC